MTFRQFWVPLLTAIFFAVCVGQAHAGERIHRFVSNVEVAKSGTLTVTETITVRAEGDQIEHGIFRDIPLTAKDAGGWSYQVGFKLLSVLQDGAPAPYFKKVNGQGVRIYIGDADVFLKPGDYTYTIQYQIDRQIRFFDGYDEVYWNVTGNEWAFPIDEAIARVVMPDGAVAEKWVAYTGVFGSDGDAYSATVEGEGREVVFSTSKPLDRYEGLTVVVAFPKGFAAEPREDEKLLAWFQAQRVLVIGSLGLAVLLVYYLATWWMVGRDPQKGIIFPRFKAPESVSPALASYIVDRGFVGSVWTSLSAACLSLAAKGYLILAKEEDVMVLRLADGTQPNSAQHTTAGPLPKGEAAIEAFLTGRGSPLALDKDNGEAIKTLGEKFRSAIADEYRGVYFVANGWYLFTGFVLSVIAVASLFLFGNLSDDEFERSILFGFLSIFSTGISFGLAHLVAKPFKSVSGEAFEGFVIWMSFAALTVGGLYLVNLLTALITNSGSQIPLLPLFVLVMVILLIVYSIYIDVPTAEGRSKLDEIEGLKLYLSVAEKERLNMSGVPEMTTVHFEKLLPYAVSLGVEQPWAESFQTWLSGATRSENDSNYHPTWYSGRDFDSSDISSSIGATATAMAGSFQSSLPAPKSSSSGSSGGGSSGGGGGGGGGGGW